MGRDFGTIGARKGADVVEVTTYRADAYDRETRKPVVEFGDSLDDDLVRRDFTVNAMALRLPDLELVDQVAGIAEVPLVVEGRVHTPAQAAAAMEHGAFAVVVGTAITHPTTITSWFASALPGALWKE